MTPRQAALVMLHAARANLELAQREAHAAGDALALAHDRAEEARAALEAWARLTEEIAGMVEACDLYAEDEP